MNDQLNDAFETYFPKFGPMKKIVFAIITKALTAGLKFRSNYFGGNLLVNERIVEYSQIIQWMKPEVVWKNWTET